MNEEERRLIAQHTAALESLNGTLAGFGTRQDYSNLLLLRMLLAMSLEAPEGVGPVLAMLASHERTPAVAVPLGIPVSKLGKESTSATTYIDILQWEIPAGHKGQLFEIYLATTDYDKTQFRLVIAGEIQWEDKYLLAPLPQTFKDNELSEGMKVLIQAKSSDGSGCTVYAAIAGKRIPPPYRKVEV